MSFTNGEKGGSISNENKGTGVISRLGVILSHIKNLLIEAPERYTKFPTPEEFERMKRNQGCGPSGGGNGTNNGSTSDELHDEELKAAAERAKEAEKRRERKGSHGMSPRNNNGWN